MTLRILITFLFALLAKFETVTCFPSLSLRLSRSQAYRHYYSSAESEADDAVKIANLWAAIKTESKRILEDDIFAASLVTNSILCKPNFTEAVISYVSNELETPMLQATQIKNIFNEAGINISFFLKYYISEIFVSLL
jgi:hypothetical protein